MSHFFSFGVVAAVAMASVAGGCSSSSSGGTSTGSLCPLPMDCSTPDPATTQLMTPTVSFQNDVAPLFAASCSLSSSCHQAKTGGPSQLYLGLPLAMMPNDFAGIYAAIVGVKSIELPSMNYVTAGDLTNSFLMHKMDGDQCVFESKCANVSITSSSGPCGVVMPQGSCALEGTQRDIVRRWIAQGAKND